MAFFLTTIGLKVKSPKVGDAARSSETRVSSNAPTQNQQQLNDSNHNPVSKDLLFFKLASDVSGGELLRQ